MSPARQDLAAQPVPQATWVQQAQQVLQEEWAPRDSAVKRATPAQMVFRVLREERALKVRAATRATRATQVPQAEPDKRVAKADRETRETRVLQEPREQMAPSAPEARVLLKAMPATRAQLAQPDS